MHPHPGPLAPDARLRTEIVDRLMGGHAFVTTDLAFSGIPEPLVNSRPPGATHSLWDLVWHIGFTQADILRFCVDPDYSAPAWPEAYWPLHEGAADNLDEAAEGFLADRARLVALVRDPATDLTAELPHAPGYTVLREALLAAEHTAYHVGQIVWVRQALGIWPPAESASVDATAQ
ncbi:MAG TPA: DinB family protein [Rubricoccaceae bacterium]|jgi:hypothetical protein